MKRIRMRVLLSDPCGEQTIRIIITNNKDNDINQTHINNADNNNQKTSSVTRGLAVLRPDQRLGALRRRGHSKPRSM